MLSGVVGCAALGNRPATPLTDRDVPVVVYKGETVTIPFDGYLLDGGGLFRCERECLKRAMGDVPPQ